MNQNKLKTITNLFDGKEIRSIWDRKKENTTLVLLMSFVH